MLEMTPEEFYWKDKINKTNLYEMRLKSLDWMLGCFDRGTIRKSTIVNLIPKQQLGLEAPQVKFLFSQKEVIF